MRQIPVYNTLTKHLFLIRGNEIPSIQWKIIDIRDKISKQILKLFTCLLSLSRSLRQRTINSLE